VLRQFLAYRFGVSLHYFDAAFSVLNLATLAELSDKAFNVENLTEFKAALAELRVAEKNKRPNLVKRET